MCNKESDRGSFLVLVCDVDAVMVDVIAETLRKDGWEVATAVGKAGGVKAGHEERPGIMPIIVTTTRTNLLRALPRLPFVLLHTQTVPPQEKTDTEAPHRLVSQLPLDLAQVSQAVIDVAAETAKRKWMEGAHAADCPVFIGSSPPMTALRRQIDVYARACFPVFIEGESGSGKELAARSLHARTAPRQPYMAVNCAAIPGELLESEMFGHVRGAFTGANHDKPGLLEAAGTGVIFLDEIGDLPPMFQAKLLRVLQEREIRRVGSNVTTPMTCRVLSASNRDLTAMAHAGHFRMDLYYRVAVGVLKVPALRERVDDIPVLTSHFVRKFAREYQMQVEPVVSVNAKRLLRRHPWPGNVRELENCMHHAVVACLAEGVTVIKPHHLTAAVRAER